jgi:hypothetical protein
MEDSTKHSNNGDIEAAEKYAISLANGAKLTQSPSDFKDSIREPLYLDAQNRSIDGIREGFRPVSGCGVFALLVFVIIPILWAISGSGVVFAILATCASLALFTVWAFLLRSDQKRDTERRALQELIFSKTFSVAVSRFYDRQYDARGGTSSNNGIGSLGSMPDKQEFGVSHQGAEKLCKEWMTYLGAEESETTSFTSDGGIDVVAASYIAQVKNYSGTVPINDVRALAGVVSTDGRKGLFFTSGNYSTGAIEFANQAGIALFVYSAENGTLIDANNVATPILENGL